MIPATIGNPLSVVDAACAAASMTSGRSLLVGARSPRALATSRAWSLMVCGRCAYSANAAVGRSGQGVVAGQSVPIHGNAEHHTALLLRQQLPPCHGSSAVQKLPVLIVDTDD